MIRYIVAALALGLLAGGTTAPARADSIASCRSESIEFPNGRKVSRIQLQADLYVARLRRLGYDVDQVEDWGGCVKAFVGQPGGRSRIMFFDPDTLEPLSTN